MRLTTYIAFAALIACQNSSTEPSGPPAKLNALPRQLTVAEQQVLGAANAFSFALWGTLNAAQRDSNVFVSPLSASFALGMTLNGAANQTLDEMRTALQVGGVSMQNINAGYKSLIELLTSLDPGVQMRIANSIWYRNTMTFHQTFFDTTRTYFGAEVQGLDFSNTAASLAAINGWVNDETSGRIPTILDGIKPDEVMFLINAIYFKGNWRIKFDPARTQDATFTGVGGVAQPVRLMHRTDTISYAESETWQAVDLPYGNTAFSMTVVLPKPGNDVEGVAAGLTPSAWQALVNGLSTTNVELDLPKLALSYERQLADDLKALGMVVPFEAGNADFTGMSPAGRELFIAFVKQKTFVDINEEGTEAAAATAVGIGRTSVPVTVPMRVDRPYIFVLRERLTGTVLFMGKIVRMPDAN